MIKKLRAALTSCFVLFLSYTVYTQTSTSSVTILVNPDHSDWKYQVGRNAFFTITVIKDGKELKNVLAHIEIGPEKMRPTVAKDSLLKKGSVTINGGTLSQPGFLRCIVTAGADGKKYRGMTTVAFSPERIASTTQRPAHFTSFWSNALSAARKIPLDARQNQLNDKSTGSINVYEISFQSYRGGSRMYGILSIPKKPGSYPAVLKLPGAGVRAYKGDTALAEKGVITLELGIHGIPVTLSNDVYYNLASGALYEYYFSNLENEDRYYYKRVYTGCVPAVDFLMTLPQVDTSAIAVYGGSQGGALAIVTAALHRQVKYVAALYPAMSDLTGYLYNRAGGWPHMFSPSLNGTFEKPEIISTAGYYDVVNFARLINIPGWYSWGYNDEVCPPTTAYAVYNNITAAKELFITKDTGHWLSPPQAEASTNWLLQMLVTKQ